MISIEEIKEGRGLVIELFRDTHTSTETETLPKQDFFSREFSGLGLYTLSLDSIKIMRERIFAITNKI